MTLTPDYFRPALRNCGACAHWVIIKDVLTPLDASGTIEWPCGLIGGTYDRKKTNHANGWRRGSDACGSWQRRDA